eukprot:2069152-Rhodomonas_salina.1
MAGERHFETYKERSSTARNMVLDHLGAPPELVLRIRSSISRADKGDARAQARGPEDEDRFEDHPVSFLACLCVAKTRWGCSG